MAGGEVRLERSDGEPAQTRRGLSGDIEERWPPKVTDIKVLSKIKLT